MTLFVTIELGRHVFHTVTNVGLPKYGHITSSKVGSVNVVKCDSNDGNLHKLFKRGLHQINHFNNS